ncbi:MAG: glutamine synthetase, partial [Eubacteriales bacterium]|nr:glutamine synthetase [Eubacteriales bacterium]
PMEQVAGSGEHTHMGIAAVLKDGNRINLFNPSDDKQFLSPIGYGALMGLLKNYDVVNPFVSATNDAFNRQKPGYEAPVCVVTSLGHDVEIPSRNRTVLVGLVREPGNPLATRLELRSPSPKSNTYLVLAASYMAMLDGIKEALENGKTPVDLEKSISKAYGEEDFYLEKNRVYRSEKNIFEDYTESERVKYFGKAPRTVWETLKAFDEHADKLVIFRRGDVMTDQAMESYKEAVLNQWSMELSNRIVPETMDLLRECTKIHTDEDSTDYDRHFWGRIYRLRNYLGKNALDETCLLTQIIEALDARNYGIASDLLVEMQVKIQELRELYSIYKKNLF